MAIRRKINFDFSPKKEQLRSFVVTELELDLEASPERHRQIHQPEILEVEPERARKRTKFDISNSSEDEELSDSEIARRRVALKKRVPSNEEMNEELAQDMIDEEKSSESSEYEKYTDSEEETGPRSKPVFVGKNYRITLMEKEEAEKLAVERKRQNLRMVEEVIREEAQFTKSMDQEGKLDDVCTDDENDEMECEAWKLRGPKRMKRDRVERGNDRRKIDDPRTSSSDELQLTNRQPERKKKKESRKI